MTPQERQLIDELFERLASLEGQPRDREAERAIAEGLARAPHALYPLVQTVLVQDEALKMAEERIRELGGDIEEPQEERGFLDNVRDAILGPDPQRRGSGSVPSVRPSVWNTQQPMVQQPMMQQPMQQQPMQPGQDYGSRGGSFLGTAAAAAAGVIGGSLLFNSLGSLMGGDKAQAAPQKFGETGADSPWSGNARDSDLSREAGLNDIGGSGREDRQGFLDSPQHFSDDPGGDGGFDFGGDGGGDSGGGDQ
jgi:hypothetical protein